MRHLRIEQMSYYTAAAGDREHETEENTVADPEDSTIDRNHKNYDAYMETVAEGTVFKSNFPGLESMRRRKQTCLGISRTAFITPLGESREDYYQTKLLLTLPWFCTGAACKNPDGDAVWKFIWEPPDACMPGESLPRKELVLTDKMKVSFEHLCQSYEEEICSKTEVVCGCCAADENSVCKSCRHAVGFHTCQNNPDRLRWRRQSLFGGRFDCERCLWNLHRKRVPIDVIRGKAREFKGRDLLTEGQVEKMIAAIEQERNIERVSNTDVQVGDSSTSSSPENLEEKLRNMLEERVGNMKAGDGVTCQYRVYTDRPRKNHGRLERYPHRGALLCVHPR